MRAEWKNQSLIINFHYVRDTQGFFAITKNTFSKIIISLKKTHDIICLDEISIRNQTKPFCILTFDDGLSDHYEFVFPLLKKFGIRANFFPSTAPITKSVILNTHIIHLLLAKVGKEDLAKLLTQCFKKRSINIDLYDFSSPLLFNKWADPLLSNIKKSLMDLNLLVSREILIELLTKYLGEEKKINKKFYLQGKQIEKMYKDGMNFGLHGDQHIPLAKLSYDEKYEDMYKSINILSKFCDSINSIAYPFGSYDNETKEIASELKIHYGLTIGEDFFKPSYDNLELPRYDAYTVAKSLGYML